jgi:hypothetical protein
MALEITQKNENRWILDCRYVQAILDVRVGPILFWNAVKARTFLLDGDVRAKVGGAMVPAVLKIHLVVCHWDGSCYTRGDFRE